MQPTFLPWSGYFNLMAQADDFVFLDDVQLEKQSWQTRNRWINGGQVQWVIAPVIHSHLGQTIAETEVMDRMPWRAKLARGFAMSYGRHPCFAEAREILEVLVEAQEHHLAALNERVIRYVAGKLKMTARLHRSSELGIGGVRSDRLVALCQHFSAKEYLSPVGSADYLAEDGFAARSPARLRFQDYAPRVYDQKGYTAFQSHLSVVDVVANLGWEKTRIYVETGSV
jgi:hypothetical protein